MNYEITVDNVMDAPYSYINKTLYRLIKIHVDMQSMDDEKFVFLLGYYSSIYQYISELYTYCIGQVRHFGNIDNKSKQGAARDRRDMLEQILRVCKLQYDSLSRKITVFESQDSRDV